MSTPIKVMAMLRLNRNAVQTLALNGSCGVDATGVTLAFSSPCSRPTDGPVTCGANTGFTLAAGSNCTIVVVFQPTAPGAAVGTLTTGSTNLELLTTVRSRKSEAF